MKYPIILSFVALSALFSSCKTSQNIANTETPYYQVNLNGLKHVLVVGLFNNDAVRQEIEKKIVASLKGKGVASYKYLPPNFLDNMRAVKPHVKIKMATYDGVLIIHSPYENNSGENVSDFFPAKKTALSFEDFNIFQNFQKPKNETNAPENTQNVEANLYSVKKDKFVWKGTIAISNQLSAISNRLSAFF